MAEIPTPEESEGAMLEGFRGGPTPTPLDAAYREGARLVAYLTRVHRASAHWAVDPAEPDWPVICIHTPAGQMSWHVGRSDLELFPADLPTRPSDWDGHTTEQKHARLARLD
jgi:hypothetical protein